MGKGADTKARIVEEATALASRAGLAGLTVATLADHLGLSKSGLFAHFGSKDALQVEVLEHAVERFTREVIVPALREPRGMPRVEAMFDNWLAWSKRMPGGCIFLAAAIELDDRPGPQRDCLVRAQKQWLETIATSFRLAQAEGHLDSSADPQQLAFELYGTFFVFHHASRLLRDPLAEKRAHAAFERITSCRIRTSPTSSTPSARRAAAAKPEKAASRASTRRSSSLRR